MTEWYKKSIEETLKELSVSYETGLSQSEAEKRLDHHGDNELAGSGVKSPWKIIWEQASAIMVIILIIAGIISLFLGEVPDAIAIITIVVLNIILGFTQEFKAEKAMAALRKMALPVVKVKRDGKIKEISSKDLVPGDIIQIDAGNSIPADCRLIEAVNLRIQEAALTGESEPIEKHTSPINGENIALGDRKNYGYMGTVSTYGRGMAVVTETGMNTELGHIATMIQSVNREATPLQKRLDQLGKLLAGIAIVIVAIVCGLGILRGENLEVMFMTAISMAVAAVPEGLPALVTIALALGTQRMLKKNALIRKLLAVETLGSVSVICSDKTGTLTQNKMTVTVLKTLTKNINLENTAEMSEKDVKLMLLGGTLCNDSQLQENGSVIGDPTEGALVNIAEKNGISKKNADTMLKRVNELPFDSDRKMMTTVHELSGNNDLTKLVKEATGAEKYISFTKGAIDGILNVSDRILINGKVEKITSEWKEKALAMNNELAKNGIRVLGFAFNSVETSEKAEESNLILAGLFGMIDPPRPEVRAAVAECKSAGIKPVMITGDHPLTALYIAKDLGITDNDNVITGAELEKMSVEDLEKVVEKTSVYARVSPEHKLKIVGAWQNKKQIVAMTGDGVNDAPALKKSNIGVAMGITGTDVSKEASDMVLLDDNFATIVNAVEEGRTIYDNIIKFIKYILSSNFAEILVMLIAPFLGMPLPLLPLQILWINLVTDGLPGLALGVEPAERNIMSRPPKRNDGNLIGSGLLINILIVGILIGSLSLGTGYTYWLNHNAAWQTMIFTIVTFAQMFYALAVRTQKDSLFTIGLFTNKYLAGAIGLTFILQFAVMYIPFMAHIFKVVPLSINDLLIAFGISALILVYDEIRKFIIRAKK